MLLGCVVAPAVADAPRPVHAKKSQLSAAQAGYLQLAQQGVRNINRYWWNRRTRWYDDALFSSRDGKASIWTTVHVFSALNGIAQASPTRGNLRTLQRFADAAYGQFWNSHAAYLRGARRWVGGYKPGSRVRSGPRAHAYYDDNGWLGLAYLEAYRSTHIKRYLRYADQAFQFIARTAWARNVGGGIWWDTGHKNRSSEGIASATALGALLYEATHNRYYLNSVKRYIAWADRHIYDARDGLYMRDTDSPILMGYVQSPMMVAYISLCSTTHDDHLCDKAEALGASSLAHFTMNLTHGPQYDAVYLHWMLDVYSRDHDPRWYQLAANNAQRAIANSRNKQGLFLRGWDGRRAPDVPPDSLRIEAATVSVFAWLAAATPPS